LILAIGRTARAAAKVSAIKAMCNRPDGAETELPGSLAGEKFQRAPCAPMALFWNRTRLKIQGWLYVPFPRMGAAG
jgi:hypothetical protein